MPFRLWLQAPRRVLVLFVTITLVPAAALGWLGWRTLKQNRALDNQREMERLELLADRISGVLDRALADLLGSLDTPATSLPEDTILLSTGPRDLEATPAGRLVDFVRCELHKAGKLVEITPIELKLLSVFVRSRGRTLSRDQLLNAVWGAGTFVNPRVVDNHIVGLRRKIEPEPDAPRYLVNVRGLTAECRTIVRGCV